jgi:FKBP-type peptidyl-prolyl cis-trans isomerase FkpA
MLRVRSPLAVLSALSVLLLGGCGSDQTTAPAPTIDATTFAVALGVNLGASTKTTSGVYYRDMVPGPGAAVLPGQTVAVHYTGWLANGTQFDTNGPSDVPFSFILGTGNVIVGWDLGIPGMRVGGQRQLIIPPSLGYGAQDSGKIPGNSILVFNVTIVSAK